MAIVGMEGIVQGYLELSLAPSTKRTYLHGSQLYVRFCSIFNVTPYPLSESILCSFASYLAAIGLSPQTVKTYLAAVKFRHVYLGYQDLIPSSALKLVQRGIARHYSAVAHLPQRTRLPITPQILRNIKNLWSRNDCQFDTIMLWAATCTGFFGFFRLGELTSPSTTCYNPEIHLTLEDVSVDDLSNMTRISLRIKQSKTDQTRVGHTLCLSRSEGDLCPVAALLAYIAARGDRQGPLFLLEDGRFLTQGISLRS